MVREYLWEILYYVMEYSLSSLVTVFFGQQLSEHVYSGI